jgi:hypothetical protein
MNSSLTRAERRMRGTMAVETSWANTSDRSARTAPGRKAAWEKFEKQVDPEGILEPAERARRAEHARKAHFTRLAYLSARARRAKGRTTGGR